MKCEVRVHKHENEPMKLQVVDESSYVDTSLGSAEIGYTFHGTVTIQCLVRQRNDGKSMLYDHQILEHYYTEHTANGEYQTINPESPQPEQDKLVPVPVSSVMSFQDDGWYIIHQFIVPTEEWVNATLTEDPTLKERYTGGFYYYKEGTDDKSGQLYLSNINKSTQERVDTPAELCELMDNDLKHTNVVHDLKEAFCTENLRTCLVKVGDKILCKQDCRNCPEKTQLHATRDLIWMLIRGIDFCRERADFSSAEHYVEWAETCNWICSQSDKLNKDCGCH